MSANKYLCYTYLIGWSKMDLWYYGVRYAQVTRKQDYDLWIDYHTTSKPIKHMRAFVGEPDVIHYDKIFDSIDEAKSHELKVLKEHNAKESPRWLNKNDIPAPPIMIGDKHPLYKKREKFKEKRNPFYGKTHTEETKERIRIKAKERFKNKENHPMFGKFHMEDTKKKLSIKAKERTPVSEKTRKKISKIHKGKVLSETTKNKIRESKKKKVLINEIIYDSYAEAAKKYKISSSTISSWVKKGKAKDM